MEMLFMIQQSVAEDLQDMKTLPISSTQNTLPTPDVRKWLQSSLEDACNVGRILVERGIDLEI
jgi:hypothetical protein